MGCGGRRGGIAICMSAMRDVKSELGTKMGMMCMWIWVEAKGGIGRGGGKGGRLTPAGIVHSLYCKSISGETRGRRPTMGALMRRPSFMTAVCMFTLILALSLFPSPLWLCPKSKVNENRAK